MKKLLLTLLLLICGLMPVAAQTETGMASYYADRFHGRPTASGEPYDKEALTAAHRTYPFGTRLKVTCVQSGLWVEVRVNDRGPHRKDRVIDLSRAAAEQLDLIRAGVKEVRVEMLESP